MVRVVVVVHDHHGGVAVDGGRRGRGHDRAAGRAVVGAAVAPDAPAVEEIRPTRAVVDDGLRYDHGHRLYNALHHGLHDGDCALPLLCGRWWCSADADLLGVAGP